jgi:hypothetical protein
VAIPGSKYLTQHSIRAVLSVIEFDMVDGTHELAQKAFLQGKHMHKVRASASCAHVLMAHVPLFLCACLVVGERMQSAAAGGVVYHHLNIPDLQNPALLADYGAFNVLEEVNVTPTRPPLLH